MFMPQQMEFTYSELHAELMLQNYDVKCNKKYLNLRMVLGLFEVDNDANFQNWIPNELKNEEISYITETTLCPCTQEISNLFYITHKHTNQTICVGSRCINHFKNQLLTNSNETMKKRITRQKYASVHDLKIGTCIGCNQRKNLKKLILMLK